MAKTKQKRGEATARVGKAGARAERRKMKILAARAHKIR